VNRIDMCQTDIPRTATANTKQCNDRATLAGYATDQNADYDKIAYA
jgi:hypothetical protein